MSHIDKVRTFMQVCEQTTASTPTKPSNTDAILRLRLGLEEFIELFDAVVGKQNNNALSTVRQHLQFAHDTIGSVAPDAYEFDTNMLEVIDAIADIDYINCGSAVLFGLDLDAAFDIVHTSNMSKIDPQTGKALKDAGGKVIKPASYIKPDLSVLIPKDDK